MKTITLILSLVVSLWGNLFALTTVSAVNPAKNALNISVATTIQVTFSNAMLASSFNDTTSFIVSGMTSGRHRGTIVLSSGNTIATFTPTVAFRKGEIVVVDLTSNLQNAGSTAITPFLYRFTVNTAIASGTFAPKTDYAAGTGAYSVFISDLDGDGDNDLAVANSGADSISVLKNNGDGTYAAKVDYATGGNPWSVFISDVDGDGDGDIAVTNRDSSTVSILKNIGDGTFAAKVDYATMIFPNSVFISDVDGDGDGDLAVANYGGHTVSILKNNGDGTFAAKVDYAVGFGPYSVFISDLDGDGDGDLAVAHLVSDYVSILKNNGDGTFAAHVDYGTGFEGEANSIFISDIDGDGDADIAVTLQDFNRVNILKNNGDGTFADSGLYVTGLDPNSVFISDVDGDGDGDLIVANGNSSSVSILKNNGNGTFAARVDYLTGTYPNAVFVSDLDGDGIADLAVANSTSNTVSILIGQELLLPSATTNNASNIGVTTAIAHGSVNANNASTTVRFVYGTVSGTYTDSVVAAQSPVSGITNMSVSALFSGLILNTTYYFRVAANNGNNYVRGSELSFTTDSTESSSDHALQFDGLNDYVTTSSPVTTATDNLTMEEWVKWDGGNSINQLLIYNGHPGENGYGIVLNPFTLPDSNLGILCGGVAYMTTSTTFTSGVWHHVAAVRSGGIWKLYLDGVQLPLSSSAVIPRPPDNATHMGLSNFKGTLDEIRVWNVARTQAEIQEYTHRTIIGSEAGLVAYWGFNEGTGSIAGDLSGNGNDETLLNGVGWITSTVPLGSGTSNTQTASTTGSVTFTGTDFQANFTAKSGTDDFVVTKINNAPGGTLPGGINAVHPAYWVVHQFGSGTFTADLTITIGVGIISAADEASPNNLKLLTRGSNDSTTASWSTLASATSANGATGEVTFENIGSFSQFAVGTTGNSPLPILLGSFTAQPNPSGRGVLMEWMTVTEINNYGFEIERKQIPLNPPLQGGSRTAGDAGGFEKLGFVEGNGTTNSPKEYSFSDKNPSVGKYVYRLKQIDRDGRFEYSQEVEFTVGTVPLEFTLMQNYPNPFNPTTTIQFIVPTNGRATLKIFNTLGQEVATLFDGIADAGQYHKATFDAKNLSSGIYFARLSSDGKSQIKKLMLMK